MTVICPRCSQDYVGKVRIPAYDGLLLLCGDCEATWFSEETIHAASFVALSDVLARLGLPYSNETFSQFVYEKPR